MRLNNPDQHLNFPHVAQLTVTMPPNLFVYNQCSAVTTSTSVLDLYDSVLFLGSYPLAGKA